MSQLKTWKERLIKKIFEYAIEELEKDVIFKMKIQNEIKNSVQDCIQKITYNKMKEK